MYVRVFTQDNKLTDLFIFSNGGSSNSNCTLFFYYFRALCHVLQKIQQENAFHAIKVLLTLAMALTPKLI